MDVAVPLAIGPGDRTFRPHEGFKGVKFTCYRCRDLVIFKEPREDSAKARHFAHHPDSNPNCDWRSASNVARDEESARRESAARHQTQRAIRVSLEIDRDSGACRLVGRIDGWNDEDASRADRLGLLAKRIPLVATGMVTPYARDLWNPDGVLWLSLDPGEAMYEVTVPDGFSNSGRWKAGHIPRGSMFVGTRLGGTLIRQPKWLSSGQDVFVIDGPGVGRPPGAVEKQLGPWKIHHFKVGPQSKDWLKARHIEVDTTPIRVDVVLPFETDSRSQAGGVVYGRPGTKVVLAIVPTTADPDLEVLPLPYRMGSRVALKPNGTGQARYLETQIPRRGTSTILVHWPFIPGRETAIDLIATGEQPRHDPDIDLECGIARPGKGLVSAFDRAMLDLEASIVESGDFEFEQAVVRAPSWVKIEACERSELDRSWQPVRAGLTTSTAMKAAEEMLRLGTPEVLLRFLGVGEVTITSSRALTLATERRLQREAQEARRQAELALLAEETRVRRLKEAEEARIRAEQEAERARAEALVRQKMAEEQRIVNEKKKEFQNLLQLAQRKGREFFGRAPKRPSASFTLGLLNRSDQEFERAQVVKLRQALDRGLKERPPEQRVSTLPEDEEDVEETDTPDFDEVAPGELAASQSQPVLGTTDFTPPLPQEPVIVAPKVRRPRKNRVSRLDSDQPQSPAAPTPQPPLDSNPPSSQADVPKPEVLNLRRLFERLRSATSIPPGPDIKAVRELLGCSPKEAVAVSRLGGSKLTEALAKARARTRKALPGGAASAESS